MEVKGIIYYKKAIILDRKRMLELEEILLNYSNSIDYKAEIENNTIIVFSSITELLSYDNYGEWKIRKITITAYHNLHFVLELKTGTANVFGSPIGYNNTIECYYRLNSIDEQKSLKDKLTTFLNKSKASYWLLGKIRTIGLLYIFGIVILPIFFYCSSVKNPAKLNRPNRIN